MTKKENRKICQRQIVTPIKPEISFNKRQFIYPLSAHYGGVTDLFSRHLMYSFFLFLHSLAASLFFISLTSLFLAASSAWLPGDPFVLLCTVTICCSVEPVGIKTGPLVPPLVADDENCALVTV